MLPLLLLFAGLSLIIITAIEVEHDEHTATLSSHHQTNHGMRDHAPILAHQYRKDPAAASIQISDLSYADKDWVRWYSHRRLHSRLFGWDTKNMLGLIEMISRQMRNRVRLVGGGSAAATSLLGCAMLFGFMSAKILKHSFVMALYGFGAAVCLLASLFIVAYLVREEGLFASTFGGLSSMPLWHQAKQVRMLSNKMRDYLSATTPILNPNGPVIATAQNMRSIIDDMGPLQRLLARMFS